MLLLPSEILIFRIGGRSGRKFCSLTKEWLRLKKAAILVLFGKMFWEPLDRVCCSIEFLFRNDQLNLNFWNWRVEALFIIKVYSRQKEILPTVESVCYSYCWQD